MEQKKTVGQATASLILGILSLIMTGILTAIPAVICGHIAKSKIKNDPANLQGDGQALAGLIMGYIVIGFSVLLIPLMMAIAMPSFVKARDMAYEKQCINNLRIIGSAKDQHAIENDIPEGSRVNAEQLGVYITGGFESIHCAESGLYTIGPIGTDPECSLHGCIE